MSNSYYGAGGYGRGGYGNQPLETLPIGYYTSLLSSEYVNSPKLNALLLVLLRKFDDVTNCMVNLDTALDLDSAVGAQLDMLGTIAGVGRTLTFQPSFGVSSVLDDATYRTCIKAKIAQNQWDGTIDSLYAVWYKLFPSATIVIADNQDMTATLFIGGLPSSILLDLIAGYAVGGATTGVIRSSLIVPRPEGVQYSFSVGALPAFGFGSSPGFIAGFGEGHW
jgi:hypothetical protein